MSTAATVSTKKNTVVSGAVVTATSASGVRQAVRWVICRHEHLCFAITNLGGADFGTIRTIVSTPRQMQFGAKLRFEPPRPFLRHPRSKGP
jgi:hypothetical protein